MKKILEASERVSTVGCVKNATILRTSNKNNQKTITDILQIPTEKRRLGKVKNRKVHRRHERREETVSNQLHYFEQIDMM